MSTPGILCCACVFLCTGRHVARESLLRECKTRTITKITGKKAITGNNVSHSKRRTKRKFNVNVFNRKFYWPEQGQWIRLTVSASGLRNINKMGLDAALKKAAEDGHLTEIQVINK